MTPIQWKELKKWNQMPSMCKLLRVEVDTYFAPRSSVKEVFEIFHRNVGSKARKRAEYKKRLARSKYLSIHGTKARARRARPVDIFVALA